MMTQQPAPASLAPIREGAIFPPLEILADRLIELDNGCILWIGSFHQKTGPFVKWRGRQYQVHRALFYYAYGTVPSFTLLRQCEPAACVAPAHRMISACA
jgi:hypothetical protein